MEEFHSTSSELGSFCVSVYVLGYATGPMIFAPLSELYGRPRVFHIANVGFIGKLPAGSAGVHFPGRTHVLSCLLNKILVPDKNKT